MVKPPTEPVLAVDVGKTVVTMISKPQTVVSVVAVI